MIEGNNKAQFDIHSNKNTIPVHGTTIDQIYPNEQQW